jgi:hypothetical protein
MKRVSRFLSPWKVLIAVVAIAASAPSARADVFLTVLDVNSNTTKTYDLGANGTGNSDANMLNISSDFAGYTIHVSYSQFISSTRASLTLNADVTGTNGDFRFTLSSSNTASTGYFQTGPTVGGGLLQTTLVVDPGLTGSGVSVNTHSGYTAFSGGSPLGQVTDGTIGLSGSGSKAGTAVGITFKPSYDLSSVTVDARTGDTPSTVSFHATAAVALPEPSGVIAAFAGLPCVGMLLGYARRLRGRPAPETAGRVA